MDLSRAELETLEVVAEMISKQCPDDYGLADARPCHECAKFLGDGGCVTCWGKAIKQRLELLKSTEGVKI